MKKCYLKTIRLYPSEFLLDIWVCSYENKLAQEFSKRYGASEEYYLKENHNSPNSTGEINSTKKSECEGWKMIVVNMTSLKHDVLIHELNHAFYHLCSILHIKMTEDNQEWHSYMLEYLFNESKNIKKYICR